MAITFLTNEDLGRCQTGTGAPTTATAGAVGTLYMDTDTGNLYKCTAVAGGAYTWDLLTGDCVLTVETITVDDSGEPVNIPVTGLTLDYTTASLKVGDTIQLACEVQPSNATNTAIIWETSSNEIATVENGLVTAVAAGDVTITARSVENSAITATCAVSVAASSSGGDESGDDNTGETTGGKVQFSTLELTQGIFKADGSIYTNFGNFYHVSVPYSEGMQISGRGTAGWKQNNYPLAVVLDNGTYTVHQVTFAETATTINGVLATQYNATLTGYGEGATVYITFATAGGTLGVDLESNLDEAGCYYYIPGGEG